MKDLLLTQLRDAGTPRSSFRRAAHQLSHILAFEVSSLLPSKNVMVITPLGVEATGKRSLRPPALFPILRSGVALLPGFMTCFPDSPIGVLGFKRDEQTAQAHRYYVNLPPIGEHDHALILDPMIATGGTASYAIELIKEHGVLEKNIIFAAIIASKHGIEIVKNSFPDVTVMVAAIDEKLNAQSYIVPGLGDFGDRYFGTEDTI